MFPDIKEIKRRRKLLGLTQKELADLAEVSQSLITKLEKGTINPSYTLMVKIFECLQQLESKVDKKAKDIMSSPVIFVTPEELVAKVTKLMKKKAFSQLPVINEQHIVVGSISDQTILSLVSSAIEENEDLELLSNKKVIEVMGDPFPIILPNTPLQAISSLLQYSPAVLVNENGKLKGIITRADMLKIIK